MPSLRILKYSTGTPSGQMQQDPGRASNAEFDWNFTTALSEQIAKTTKNGIYIVVERAGHSVSLKASVQINRALTMHFERADAEHEQRTVH